MLKSLTTYLLILLTALLPVQSVWANGQSGVHNENAKMLEKSADANKATGTTQAIAAGICGVACAAALADWAIGGTAKVACNVAGIGAGVHDFIENKNISSLLAPAIAIVGPALTSGGSIGDAFSSSKSMMTVNGEATEVTATYDTNGNLTGYKAGKTPVADANGRPIEGSGAEGEVQSESNGDKMTCLSFIIHTATAYTKFEQAKDDEKAAKEAKLLVASLKSSNGTSNPSLGTSNAGKDNKPMMLGLASAGPNGEPATEVASERSCSKIGESGDSSAFFNCVRASNSSGNGSGFLDPNFRNSFEEITGNNLDDLVGALSRSGASTGAKIAAAAGPKMAGADIAGAAEGIAALLSDEQKDILRGGYSPSGGGSGGEGGGGKKNKSLDINKAMEGLLAGLTGEKPKEDESGLQSASFKGKKVDAEAIWRDRNISLFERVTYRYQQNISNLRKMTYSTGYNRSAASQNEDSGLLKRK